VTHPLQQKIKDGHPTRRLGRPFAAVMVERDGQTLRIIPEQFKILKPDTQIAELPDDIAVMAPVGKQAVPPERRFWITVQTFDPYHAVLDWDGQPPAIT
jgi:hypothetical protein